MQLNNSAEVQKTQGLSFSEKFKAQTGEPYISKSHAASDPEPATQQAKQEAMRDFVPAALRQDVVAVSYTLVSSDDLLTKTATVGPTGQIVKSGKIWLTSGVATRMTATGTPNKILLRVKETLESLNNRQAIICAPPPLGKDEWPLVTHKQLSHLEGAIARKKETFVASNGPALLCLDFDTADFSKDLLARLEQAGSISKALAQVYRPFEDAAVLTRNSASSAVVLKGEKAAPLASGHHRYFVVSDGSQVAETVKILADRLMLAGFIWGRITKTGSVMPRTLFDVDASCDSSRLFYEAHPVLHDTRLSIDERNREIKVFGERLLDLSGLTPLTEEEHERLEQIKAALAVKLEPDAAPIREAWRERRIRELVGNGTSEEAARRVVNHALGHHELTGAFEIAFDDNTTATVREIRADPMKYHEKTCPDPFEPDYGAGRNLGILYATGSRIHIHSHAHGGIDYTLAADKDDFFEDLPDDPAPAREKPLPPHDGERSEAPSSAPAAPSRMKLETIDDIELAFQEAPQDPLIEGVLDQGAFSCVYGASNVGKTFIAMDMAWAIAQGHPWAGQPTTKKSVLYVAAEGGRGVFPRIKALIEAHGRVGAKDFVLLRSKLNLFASDADVKELLREAKAAGLNDIGLIVIDTLARSMDGGDENGVKDMNRVVGHVDLLRKETDAHIMLVHHTGKIEAKGMRGSSALRAALDTEIELQKATGDGPTGGTLAVTKQRDMDGNFARDFTLEAVKLVTTDGRGITSCVARMSTVKTSRRERPSSKQQKLLNAMLDLGAEVTGVEVQEIAAALDPQMTLEGVRSLLRRCQEKNFVRVDKDGLWLVGTNCPGKDSATWFESTEERPKNDATRPNVGEGVKDA